MNIDSARDLKESLASSFLQEIDSPIHASALSIAPSRSNIRAQPGEVLRSVALGIAPHGKKEFKLAIRIQRRGLEDSREVQTIIKKARGEVDLQYVGRIQKLATSWHQKRQRPLLIGCSVGHHKITAGTLGCFVKPIHGDAVMMLSNNHVLANENNAAKGDAILQPGNHDGGTTAADKVAKLGTFVRLKPGKTNLVDAAVATLEKDVTLNSTKLKGLGTLTGQGSDFLDVGAEVSKVGRTTGVTQGRVTAFELDNVVVDYEIGRLRFDNQVEIEGAGTVPFSRGGDSGSVIVTPDGLVVALLFAGGEVGGTNNQGLTFANPIGAVFTALKVQLFLD